MVPLEKYPKVQTTDTLRAVIIIMDSTQIEVDGKLSLPRVVLVFDEHQELRGMARRRDVLRGLEPKFLVDKEASSEREWIHVKVDPNLAVLSYGHSISQILQNAQRPISSVMSPVTTTLSSDDHLLKIMNVLVEQNLSVLPVLDAGKVIGVIRTADVFRYIAKALFLIGPDTSSSHARK